MGLTHTCVSGREVTGNRPGSRGAGGSIPRNERSETWYLVLFIYFLFSFLDTTKDLLKSSFCILECVEAVGELMGSEVTEAGSQLRGAGLGLGVQGSQVLG